MIGSPQAFTTTYPPNAPTIQPSMHVCLTLHSTRTRRQSSSDKAAETHHHSFSDQRAASPRRSICAVGLLGAGFESRIQCAANLQPRIPRADRSFHRPALSRRHPAHHHQRESGKSRVSDSAFLSPSSSSSLGETAGVTAPHSSASALATWCCSRKETLSSRWGCASDNGPWVQAIGRQLRQAPRIRLH